MTTGRRFWFSVIGISLTWTASRVFMAYMWWSHGQFIDTDVMYYYNASLNPDATALAEYPTPILWLMRLLVFVCGHDSTVFFNVFIIAMLALDALVTAVLFWRCSPLAAAYWIVFLALLGPIIWFRIDLIPAACVTLGLLELQRSPRLSGALLAVGAATKLWPALLILPTSGFGRPARRRLASFAVAGGGLAVLSLVIDGWTRSVSPIMWQTQRGLQIESLSATWAMILHATRPGVVIVQMSQFNAYEVFSHVTDAGLTTASVLMAVAIGFTLLQTYLLVVRPIIRHRAKADVSYAMLLSVTAVVAAVIAADKTFSPQYLMWLAGPLGLTLAFAKTSSQRRAAIVMAVLGCVVAGLTQSVFPLNYVSLIANPLGGAGATTLLVARNACMAGLTLFAMVWSIRESDRAIRDIS